MDTQRSSVLIDPENLADCMTLADALYECTGTEHDPAAIRDALRSLRLSAPHRAA